MGRRINDILRRFRPGRHSIKDLPKPHDVICCFFPDHDGPARWPHPALVREAKPIPELGEADVYVYYGTSTIKEWRASVDLIIDGPDVAAVGLTEPTRFDMEKLLPLEWKRENFPTHRIIGTLNAACIRRFEERTR
jgi:hypothetical protein